MVKPPSAPAAVLTKMPPGLSAMIARAGKETATPPVDRWNPPFCGKLPMTIKADGQWYYMGTPIAREALVRLFASVLRLEPDGSTCLVTPVERIEIEVEDAPFLAVELHVASPNHKDRADREGRRDDQIMTIRTNVGDIVEIGPEHPLSFQIEPKTGGLKPYVEVRRGLLALFSRSVAMDLVAHADPQASTQQALVFVSKGARFSTPLAPAGPDGAPAGRDIPPAGLDMTSDQGPQTPAPAPAQKQGDSQSRQGALEKGAVERP